MEQRVSAERRDPDAGDRASPSAEKPQVVPERDAKDADRDKDRGSASKRHNVLRRHPWWFVSAALLAAAAIAGGYVFWQVYIYPYETTDDAFVDARSYVVAPKVTGYVTGAPVTDNQHVDAGAVLFQIDKRDYQVAVEQAEAQVAAAEASIQNIDAQIDGQKAQVEVSKAQVTQAQASLKFAQEDASRYKDLAATGAGSVQRQQQTNSTLQQQQAAFAQAQASVTLAEKQVRSLQAQRANAEAQLSSAKAKLDQARLDLGYTTVTAAQAGRIVRLTGAKGQFAQAGAGLSNFVPDEIWVTANFKETQVTDMRPGQRVDIEIDAYPDRKITGRVDSVQPGSGTAFSLLPAENATGNYVKVVQRIPVKIVVDDWPKDVAIGPGMSVVPSVHVR